MTTYDSAEVCIDCGTRNVSEPDTPDGMIDCFECGAAWIPGVALKPGVAASGTYTGHDYDGPIGASNLPPGYSGGAQ